MEKKMKIYIYSWTDWRCDSIAGIVIANNIKEAKQYVKNEYSTLGNEFKISHVEFKEAKIVNNCCEVFYG